MKVTARMVAIVVTAGIAGVGALALMTPAVASVVSHPMSWVTGNGTGMGAGAGHGMGRGQGNGPGAGDGLGNGPGQGNGSGMHDGTSGITAAQGTMTDAQRSTLAALAQEEKLAHDLYTAFGDKYDVMVFDRIATAEERHLTELRTLMGRYQVTDPTAGQAAGKFTDPAVQGTYDRLLADGSKDQKSAMVVGKTVEQADIDDLRRGLEGLTAPDTQQGYTHLSAASSQHLATFDKWANR